ncbi:MAG: hypothetical protein HIU81_10495 [Acidobacteria bacterium]|nr:hypothetical protein [Acidobacteriota bacterium]
MRSRIVGWARRNGTAALFEVEIHDSLRINAVDYSGVKVLAVIPKNRRIRVNVFLLLIGIQDFIDHLNAIHLGRHPPQYPIVFRNQLKLRVIVPEENNSWDSDTEFFVASLLDGDVFAFNAQIGTEYILHKSTSLGPGDSQTPQIPNVASLIDSLNAQAQKDNLLLARNGVDQL